MRKHIVSISVFLLMIFGMSIFNMLKPTKSFSDNENRVLQQMPDFSIDSLLSGEFTSKYEKYITDQFMMRDDFIEIKTLAELALGKKENKGVYIGKDGYLLQIIKNVDDLQVQKNIDALAAFAKKNDNVKFLIVPTASEILTDKLPDFANPYDQSAVIDKIKDAVGSENFIDVQDALKAHDEEYIYYKTDHHYTSLGAFYVANEYKQSLGLAPNQLSDYTINDVSDTFFGTMYSQAPLGFIKPDTITQYDDGKKYHLEFNMGEKFEESLYQESFLETKDQYSYFLGGNNPLVKITTENKNGKKLMIVKDSYAHALVPFIASEYEEVHILDLRYFNMSPTQYAEQNGITDTLVIYNAQGFLTDLSVYKIGF